MKVLEVDYQFSPAYHPQSNQTERANRFITETLRAVVNQKGASKMDWQKYIKFVEFGMRRLPIPGTNITPFMAMRGRDPVLTIDQPLVAGAPVLGKDLDEHVKEMVIMKNNAEKLIKSAREKTLRLNKDLHDVGRTHIQFSVGDLVRMWGVQRSTKGQASKLKLRNGVYKVTGRNNDLYDLQSTLFPEITRTNVHVSFIARWRGTAPEGDHGSVVPVASSRASGQPRAARGKDDDDDGGDDARPTSSEQTEFWDKLKEKELVVFVMRDQSPSNLRVAEVVSLTDDKRSGEFWYWIDCAPGKYNPAKPLIQRKLTPEWSDERGYTRCKPTVAQTADWSPRQHALSFEDIEIIVPVAKMHVGGKIAPQTNDKVTAWLKRRARTDKRAQAALRSLVCMDRAEKPQVNDECAALMRASILQAEVAHEEGRDGTAAGHRLGEFLCKRVPTGHAASPAAHTEELEKRQAEFESMNRIEKLFYAWRPW